MNQGKKVPSQPKADNSQNKKLLKNKSQGFTLIEILVVIGLIAILAAIVIVAINPNRQFAEGRSTQRQSNVEAILNSIGQNIADNKGVFSCGSVSLPTSSSTVPSQISASMPGALKIASSGGVDLSCLSPTYISSLPYDPSATGAHWTSATDYDTGYYVIQDSSGRITVYAPTTESALSQVNYIALTR